MQTVPDRRLKPDDILWAEALETRISTLKRKYIDTILGLVFTNLHTVDHFLPTLGCTVGQLAFYSCLRPAGKK